MIPILTTVLYVIWINPYFERKLLKINSGDSGKGWMTGNKDKWQTAVARIICFNKAERAYYRFSRNILANERKLKLRLYPTLALAAAFPVITLSGFLRSGKPLSEVMMQLANGKYYFTLYLTAIMLMGSVRMLSTSEKYTGAWIYRTLPLESPVPILKGTLKGFISKFIVPIYFLCGVLAGIHSFLQNIPFGIVLNIIGSLAVITVLWHRNYKLSWKEIIYGR